MLLHQLFVIDCTLPSTLRNVYTGTSIFTSGLFEYWITTVVLKSWSFPFAVTISRCTSSNWMSQTSQKRWESQFSRFTQTLVSCRRLRSAVTFPRFKALWKLVEMFWLWYNSCALSDFWFTELYKSEYLQYERLFQGYSILIQIGIKRSTTRILPCFFTTQIE